MIVFIVIKESDYKNLQFFGLLLTIFLNRDYNKTIF